MTACPATPVDKRSRLIAAVLGRVLRPLVRILLRLGVPYQACAETLKWVYVDVAYKDFGIAGRKQTKSRVTVITGLSHVEVDKQLRDVELAEPQSIRRWHRAGRVLSHWTEDPEFSDSKGNPAALPLEGSCRSFHNLVENHSGGATVRAVLDELLRSKAVELDGGYVRLLKPSYLTDASHDDAEKLDLLGLTAGDLLSTIEWNIRPHQADPRAQHLVVHEDFPAAIADEARQYINAKTQALAREVDSHLNELAETHNPHANESVVDRLGLGLYFFQDAEGLTEETQRFR